MKRSKQLEEAVRKYLDIKGYEYIRVDSYRCFKCGQVQNASAKGFPDFLVIKPLTAIEVKTDTGRLSVEQIEFKELWQAQGLPYILLRDTIDELLEYFGDK